MYENVLAMEFDPNSDEIAGFVREVRKQCSEASYVIKGNKVKLFLFGGYTTTLDVQDALYKLVPVMISTTLIAVLIFVGISFGSVLLALRLLFTIAVSLVWTYGFMVTLYHTLRSLITFT